MIDSQSVKAPQARARGYDAGKKIVGRKRHIAVDTDGRLLMVNLTTADISDSAGAQAILDGIRKRWPWVKHLFADGAYDRLKLMDKAAYLDFVVEIIRRSDDQKGLPGPATPLGRRAHLRLDDPMAASRARLRATHRRLARHDPRRHGRQSHPTKRSSLIFKTDFERIAEIGEILAAGLLRLRARQREAEARRSRRKFPGLLRRPERPCRKPRWTPKNP